MNTKGISGSTQVGPLHTDKSSKTQDLLHLREQSKNSKTGTGSGYGVNLSREAKDLASARAKAMAIAKGAPDVREERIAELRKRIQSGQYKVDSGKVADGMLKEALKDEIAAHVHNEAKSR